MAGRGQITRLRSHGPAWWPLLSTFLVHPIVEGNELTRRPWGVWLTRVTNATRLHVELVGHRLFRTAIRRDSRRSRAKLQAYTIRTRLNRFVACSCGIEGGWS